MKCVCVLRIAWIVKIKNSIQTLLDEHLCRYRSFRFRWFFAETHFMGRHILVIVCRIEHKHFQITRKLELHAYRSASVNTMIHTFCSYGRNRITSGISLFVSFVDFRLNVCSVHSSLPAIITYNLSTSKIEDRNSVHGHANNNANASVAFFSLVSLSPFNSASEYMKNILHMVSASTM